ncbi:hypothetical protein LQ757_18270 [Agromyces sp. SYSU K20354]|uniref:hypothetical protein n=1 Tax=Agromyces cavernae TaxID=2898659 RepID=UPI001E63F367|nr:hypothetical protein [Agromyces cavernae]MCD2444232.1 hypothetical protein [Agromyces cavernae]
MDLWSGLTIDTRELRDVFERLITHLEQTRGESVTLHEDYFYSMPYPEIYDVLNGPPSPTIGSLTETWDNLQGDKDIDSTIMFELVWLGDLLKALGHLA